MTIKTNKERTNMIATACRFRFNDDIDLNDAQDTLLLAVLAAGGIFGQDRMNAAGRCCIDQTINTIIIDAQTEVGMIVSLIFRVFATAQFGKDSFNFQRVQILPQAQL